MQLHEQGLGPLFQNFSDTVTPEELAARAVVSSGEHSDEAWTGATHEMMRASCAYFASEVLRGPAEPPYSGKFLVAEHHEEWDDLVTSKDRICVLAPRDHGKSFFFDFAYPIWKAAFKPGGKGYIFSATKEQAIRILSDIKEELESNPKLAWLVPKVKEQWSATAIRLSNGHRIYARGFGTKIRGAHPDWIVVDDGLNDEDAYSQIVRQKHVDYFLTAITNMIVPDGQIVVVGTPFHGADLYAYLSKNSEYTFRKYAALDKATGRALWPERYGSLRLEKRRREIGNVRFTREFLCEPISDEMSLFPEYLFRGDPVEQYACRLGAKRAFWESMGVKRFFIGVDFALSAEVGADYFVLFVVGLDAFGNRWVVDIIRGHGWSFEKQKSVINAAGRKYDADLIFLESNQMQRIFGDQLIRETDLPIKKFVTTGTGKGKTKPKSNTTSQNKNSLEGGVPSVRVLLENQKWRIPRGDAHSVEVTELWIQEMKSFTWLEGKLQGVGSHDDTVMACWIADQAVRAGGFSFSTGDEAETGSLEDLLREQMGEDPDEEKAADEEEAEGYDDGEEDDLVELAVSGKRRKKAALRLRILEHEEDPDEDGGDLVEDSLMGQVAAQAWARVPGLGMR